MLKSYLKIILRNLYREKIYSAINVLGLSIGVASFLVLWLFISNELTYDRHNVNADRIYRIGHERNVSGDVNLLAQSSFALGPFLAREYSEVQAYVRFRRVPSEQNLYRYGDKQLYWGNVMFAEDTVFDVFTHRIVYGDPKTAWSDPTSIAVSETFARTYFGDENPVGKVMATDVDGLSLKIGVVFADLPRNSHLKYDVLLPYGALRQPSADIPNVREALWGYQEYTYLLMSEDFDPKAFDAKLEAFYDKYMRVEEGHFHAKIRLVMEPLTSIHLFSTAQRDFPRGNKFLVYVLIALSVFVLAIACANYMNLATARSTKRRMQAGVRKVFGAERHELITYFLSESLVFAAVGLVVGLGLVYLFLKFGPTNDLLGAPFSVTEFARPWAMLGLVGLAVVVGLVAGAYPALYLSAGSPIATIKGDQERGSESRGLRVRRFLVFFQFAMSVGVIASALLMYAQVDYIRTLPLGYDKENKINMRLQGADAIEQVPFFLYELQQNPHVLGGAVTSSPPGYPTGFRQTHVETNDGPMGELNHNFMLVEQNYLDLIGVKIVEGRGFDSSVRADSKAVLVNESFVRAMGWDRPIGKRLAIDENDALYPVIGVVKDFNFESAHSPVGPLALMLFRPLGSLVTPLARASVLRDLVISVSNEDVFNTIDFIKSKWEHLDPVHPFVFRFAEDTLDGAYLSDQRQMKLTGIFSALCVFVSCLGLVGLAAFETEQRSREIAIRKVMGASATEIVLMLFKDVFFLALFAALVGSAAAYWLISNWLTGFFYRAEVNPLVFAVASVAAIGIAFVTTAFQSYHAAERDPVRALHAE
jgi:putative ABC transport system permease protein